MLVKAILALVLFLFIHAAFAEVLFYDRHSRTCVKEVTPMTLRGPFYNSLWPCYQGTLTGVNIKKLQTIFDTLYFQATRINYSVVYEQEIRNIYLDQASFKQGMIISSKFQTAFFSEADLRGTIIESSEFRNFSFTKADLRGVKISRSKFMGGDLLNANFKGTFISDSHFEDCVYSPELKKDAILINVTFKNCHEKTL